MKTRPHSNGNYYQEKLWQEQKEISGWLPYHSVLQKLDDLTTAGFTCLQIEEMLNLGEIEFKLSRLKNKK